MPGKLSKTRRRENVRKGKRLEAQIERLAKKYGFIVEKRKKYGDAVIDLVLKKKGVVYIIECKNYGGRKVGMDAVKQAEKAKKEYIRELLGDVVPVVVGNDFNEDAKKRASRTGVRLYKVEEIEKLMFY